MVCDGVVSLASPRPPHRCFTGDGGDIHVTFDDALTEGIAEHRRFMEVSRIMATTSFCTTLQTNGLLMVGRAPATSAFTLCHWERELFTMGWGSTTPSSTCMAGRTRERSDSEVLVNSWERGGASSVQFTGGVHMMVVPLKRGCDAYHVPSAARQQDCMTQRWVALGNLCLEVAGAGISFL